MRMRSVMAAMGVALLCAAPARAATITVESLSVAPDSHFFLSIGISADVANLIAFSFDVNFDPAVLALEGVQEGNFLSRGGATAPCTVGVPGETLSCTTTPGSVSIGNFGLDLPDDLFEPVSGSGTGDVLVILAFQALSTGTTLVDLALPSFLNSAFEEIPSTLVPGTVTIGTPARVPEPSTILLMGIGVAGLARRQWRRTTGKAMADLAS